MMTRFVLVGLVCLATLSAVNAAQNLSASRRLKFYSLERFLGVRSPSAKQMPNIMLPTTMDGTTRMPPVDMCSCASDGVSGGISTGRLGCQDHAHGFGSIGAFCMVVGGPACSESHPSIAFAGASWKQCTTVDQSQMDDHPCTCSNDGMSRSITTGRSGCRSHLENTEPFCYVKGGTSCPSAKRSIDFPGASWRDCGKP